MRFQHLLLGITAAILTVFLIIHSYSDRIFVYMISRSGNFDMSYTALQKSGKDELVFKGLGITDKKTGLGIFSENAVILRKASAPGLKSIDLGFTLDKVHFLNNSGGAASYEDIAGLVAVPFKENWVYDEISGEIGLSEQKTRLKDISAIGHDIRLAINGTIYKNDNADLDIKVGFSNEASGKIPKEFAELVLADDGKGWKWLVVHLSGNFSQPAIQLSGKLFRLNIRSVSDQQTAQN